MNLKNISKTSPILINRVLTLTEFEA